ncbi:MAG TPA: hypothetical protein VFU02_01945 [Polyangiaceae bacterium]|nr:hypothetical protein [Polyangiaceae bacterium]
MWSAPATNTSEFSLEFGTTRFCVDPNVGGRITEFSLNGENVLYPLEDLGDWTNGGSTFWTSPQSAWGWPPNPLVDRSRYVAHLDDTRHRLLLESQPFELSGSTLTVTKQFWPDQDRGAVMVEYVVRNHGAALSLAGWEVSRIALTGQSFFAGRQTRALGGLPPPRTASDAAGWTWMDHAEQLVEAKLGADAALGFVAYTTPRVLFLKQFEEHPASTSAPGEAQIELYVKPQRYVEIEQQGPYRELGPGEELTYRVRWYIRSLEPGAPRTAAVELTRHLLNDGGSRA